MIDAQLLHHLDDIESIPTFHDLASGQAKDAEARYRYLVTGRSDAHELVLVRGARGPTNRHPIPLGDYILNDVAGVGEGDSQLTYGSLEVFWAG